MVSKCANPKCSEEFLYFGSGKLFKFESSTSRVDIDFHWLCDRCVKHLRLEKGEDGELLLTPLDHGEAAA